MGAEMEKDQSHNTVKELSLASSHYGFTTRALNDVVNALRQSGVEKVLDLPKIAVIGNQSSGKSSLIESISGITVPRRLGTCTRCPMEVILRSGRSGEWSCKVSIRFDPTQGKVHFKTVDDKQLVESICDGLNWQR